MKQAEALPSNEEQSVDGKMDLYEDPAGRATESPDDVWGEKPKHDADHNGEAAWQGHKDTQQGVLSRAFTNTAAAAANAKATIGQNFSPGYETRSPLLNYKTASAHAPSGETLTDKVRRVCGRR